MIYTPIKIKITISKLEKRRNGEHIEGYGESGCCKLRGDKEHTTASARARGGSLASQPSHFSRRVRRGAREAPEHLAGDGVPQPQRADRAG